MTATNLPYFIHNQVLIKLEYMIMNLKVFYVSFINLLVALAVYSANAQTNPNDKYLEIAKENYINKKYTNKNKI